MPEDQFCPNCGQDLDRSAGKSTGKGAGLLLPISIILVSAVLLAAAVLLAIKHDLLPKFGAAPGNNSVGGMSPDRDTAEPPEPGAEPEEDIEEEPAGVEIFHTLTDQEKRALNIFLSNFSEAFFEYYNAYEERTSSNSQALLSFAVMHYYLNLADQIEGVKKEGNNYSGIRLEKIATKLNRYFYNLNCTPGFIDLNANARKDFWFSDGKYLLMEPADGATIARFSQVESLLEEEDGTLRAEIDIYTFESRPGDDLRHGDVPNWVYDPRTKWSGSNKADATKVDTATAALIRYEHLGKPSYQLVEYKMKHP